jgi:acyl-CoA synthetase (AMP-forming)/AMP-acid ligase II
MVCIATETGAAVVGVQAATLNAQISGAAHLSHLQYTSGSTAEPRGVMISHDNLLHTLEDIAEGLDLTSDSLAVNWMPHYHDMGLIFGLLEPIYRGFPCVLIAPWAFMQRPQRWLRAMAEARATHSGGPNFAYDLCVATIKEETRTQLDLSCWAVAAIGAEPVNPATLDRFVQAFAVSGFRRSAFVAGYGLAEATLKVTNCRPGDEPVVVSVDRVGSFVSCGRPGRNGLRIVDPDSGECLMTGEIGEIWVSGPSIGLGYWNRPEETARVFSAWLRNGEGPFLRTGDLGFMKDGQLFVTGRLKDLIIIGGRNYYPQDIERTVERCHAALRPGRVAAFAVRDYEDERLVVAAEVGRSYRSRGAHENCPDGRPHSLCLDAAAVMHAIRRAVTEAHEVELTAILLINNGKLPTTSSGKVQRYLCRDGYLQGTLDFWSPPWVRAVKLFSHG